ncbi:MAG TPA: signal recognition particle protein [Chloroflexota bacterium]|nr:signal recognition particle protein [Chloroflexota bacterium]
MFDTLQDRLEGVFTKLRGKGKLTEADVDAALREVRMALLEADVNFKVVKDLQQRIREKTIGEKVMESLTPAQHVVKIVHDELVELLGGGQSRLETAGSPPTVVMLVGLNGAGKTTSAAKLALFLRKQNRRPLLVAADVYRPAAIDQLVQLGKQLNIPVYSDPGAKPPDICVAAVKKAREDADDVVILDTAGRLQINEELMAELEHIKARVPVTETLFVADAMTGQEAVNVAQEFHAHVPLTGLILTKMDGDARGGAALSIRAVTGVPVKFVGIGEKADALEPFYPDRIAQRILGMGDVLSLIEKAQDNLDQQKAVELEKKMRTATFGLDDFLDQLQQIKKMGSLTQIMEMIPGMGALTRKLGPGQLDESQLKRVEAIIYSMTPNERRNPKILDGSRKKRIARGSGTTPHDINQLLTQFGQMQAMMKQFTKGRMPKHLRRLMAQGGGAGLPGFPGM